MSSKTNNPTDEAKEVTNGSNSKIKYGNIKIKDMEEIDNRTLRIYLDGVFDMTHYGHFRLFKQVKDKFPNSTIIVGVSGDEETIRLKGNIVMNERERAETIGFCKCVDEVICPCPWTVTPEFIDKHNIDYVAHDAAPYGSNGSDDIYGFVKEQGRFIATERTEGVSTTGLINRIICRYNEYVLRNLKRGITRKELNVSWTRQKRIEMKAEWDKITDNVAKWMDEPHTAIDDFLKIFGEDGKIINKLKEKRKEIIHDIREKRDEIIHDIREKRDELIQDIREKRNEIIHEHPELSGVLSSKFIILCIVVAVIAIGLCWAKKQNLW